MGSLCGIASHNDSTCFSWPDGRTRKRTTASPRRPASGLAPHPLARGAAWLSPHGWGSLTDSLDAALSPDHATRRAESQTRAFDAHQARSSALRPLFLPLPMSPGSLAPGRLLGAAAACWGCSQRTLADSQRSIMGRRSLFGLPRLGEAASLRARARPPAAGSACRSSTVERSPPPP